MDQQEFATRAEAIKARLYRTAYLYLGSEADALDAVSEAICRALQGLKHLRQPELFETWITRILINTCSSELRRRSFFHLGGEEYQITLIILIHILSFLLNRFHLVLPFLGNLAQLLIGHFVSRNILQYIFHVD